MREMWTITWRQNPIALNFRASQYNDVGILGKPTYLLKNVSIENQTEMRDTTVLLFPLQNLFIPGKKDDKKLYRSYSGSEKTT